MIKQLVWTYSILLLFALGTPSCRVWGKPAAYGPGQPTGIITDDRLTEISGIVASRKQPQVLWVHNDSGDEPFIYAINPQGHVLATYRVTGALAHDWEDIAIGPGPAGSDYLYLGDIGDNQAKRPFISVYRVPEPKVSSPASSQTLSTEPCLPIRLSYFDGARDAETLFVEPQTGHLFIVSKRDLFSRVYMAQAPFEAETTSLLKLQALLPWGLATGGDLSSQGQTLLIRNPTNAMLWQRQPGQSLAKCLSTPGLVLTLQPESQGEAICFGDHDTTIYSISEGRHPTLYRYRPRPSN